MFKHILVPTDGSPLSGKAVDAAIKLAIETDARITALYVMERFPVMPVTEYAPLNVSSVDEFQKHQQSIADRYLGVVADAAREARVTCKTEAVMGESIYQAIVVVAERCGCDLILMASHGRRGLQSLLLGSETNKVLTHSKIPVLVYR